MLNNKLGIVIMANVQYSLPLCYIHVGFCLANLCPQGYRPYTCSSCVNFTKNVQAFSNSPCEGNGTLVQIEDPAQLDTLQRYVDVLDHDRYWIGYEIKNGAAKSVSSSTESSLVTTLLNSQTQSCTENCCVAVQSDGLISVKCDEELPYMCSVTINCKEMTHIHTYCIQAC